MMMMARSHGSELTQEAAQGKRAGQARRSARVRRAQPAPRPAQAKTAKTRAPRRASWLATAAARLRPTIAGR
ncbi:MAG: hypothetical protein ABSA02_07170 [Trebonia sp.]